MAGPLLAVEREESHHHQGEAAPQDMAEHTPLRGAAPEAVVDGERHRHAHAEEEGREDGVAESQHVLIGGGMEEPVGHALKPRDVVDKEHQHHGKGADGVDARHTAGGGLRHGLFEHEINQFAE